ncbi:hypothetical protein [Streptomyces sp. CBMA156]|uniref:hypothetical protein n=1 Tax=Streptomyces sp. CBMA156 TaxID=1930280 RepID=UPI001661A23F|nr:hypothetical protein [Streptomyces sp. CBMA156]MBD0675479.1 hypothetical protein [Streptomyces sp. CBMA156]
MTSDRRPLWRPFSEPAAADPVPVQPYPEARLTAVERAPFLEPAPAKAQPSTRGARRPLGPGGLAAG